jgi:hypothetical protein
VLITKQSCSGFPQPFLIRGCSDVERFLHIEQTNEQPSSAALLHGFKPSLALSAISLTTSSGSLSSRKPIIDRFGDSSVDGFDSAADGLSMD